MSIIAEVVNEAEKRILKELSSIKLIEEGFIKKLDRTNKREKEMTSSHTLKGGVS